MSKSNKLGRVILIRHGESIWNTTDKSRKMETRFTGWLVILIQLSLFTMSSIVALITPIIFNTLFKHKFTLTIYIFTDFYNIEYHIYFINHIKIL